MGGRSSEVETGRLKAFAMVVSKRASGRPGQDPQGGEAEKGRAARAARAAERTTNKASARAARKQPVEADGEAAQRP